MHAHIAKLVASHRDYCEQFIPDRGTVSNRYTGEELTIEQYQKRVSSHLTMTTNKISHLIQRG